jgi:hypothetical protein
MADPAAAPKVLSTAAKPFVFACNDHAVASQAPRGSWWWWGADYTAPRSLADFGISIKCGACDFSGRITDPTKSVPAKDQHYSVEPDGSVSPSIVCPKCGWHVFGRLDGWISVDHESVILPPSAMSDTPAPTILPKPVPPAGPLAASQADVPRGTSLAPLPTPAVAAPLAPVAASAPPAVLPPAWQCTLCRATFTALADRKAHPHLPFGATQACPSCRKGTLQRLPGAKP